MKMERIPITSWAEADRPREKLLTGGRGILTDAELFAILLGSGNTEESAVELARRILNDHGNRLEQTGKVSVKELMRYKGVGEAKAITLAAAMELGRRRKEEQALKREVITCSDDVHGVMYSKFADLPHEEFWVLLLNRANKIIGRYLISRGGVDGTVSDPKLIFKHAIEQLASSVILCHNHPSGNLKPSKSDVQLTNKLKKAGEVMDIEVLDHLILSAEGYFSFADEGML